MARYLCWLLLFAAALVRADDIDIYLRALQRATTAEVVLFVDWPAAARAGWAAQLPAQLAAALRQVAVADNRLWGPPAVAVTLLAPRVKPCPDSLCVDPEWELHVLPDLRRAEDIAALEQAMQALVAAARTGQIPDHSPDELESVLAGLLSGERCAPPQLVQLAAAPDIGALAAVISDHWAEAVINAAGLKYTSLIAAVPTTPPDQAFTPYFQPSPVLPWRGGLAITPLATGDGGIWVDQVSGRPLGALMHSVPSLVNYGPRTGFSESEPDLRVLVGSNDGAMHMLHLSSPVHNPEAVGRAAWAWMPAAMIPRQPELAGVVPVSQFPYGVDGAPVIYRRDTDNDGLIDPDAGDRVWLFFGLRRGGAGLYALDISDPDAPQQLWGVNPHSTGFERLGLTFAAPQPVLLDLGEEERRPALLIGGGYSDSGDRGNALYLVDMATGSLLWSAAGGPLQHGLAASPAVLDGDGDGATDRAYIADTGGQVWRVDLPQAGPGWQGQLSQLLAGTRVRLLARLGGAETSARRFFHRPDVVRTRDGFGDYDGVLLVSGDRSNPLEHAVHNYAYLIKDRGGASVLSHDGLTDVTELCRRPDSPECIAADLEHGWALALRDAGEKGMAPPLVRSGKVYFSSYVPDPHPGDLCDAGLGQGRVYVVNLLQGAPALREIYPARTWDDGDDTPLEARYFFAVGQGIPGPVSPYRDLLLLPGEGPDGSKLLDPGGTLRWRVHWRDSGVDLQ